MYALPGYGKSTKIAQLCQPGDVVVALTRGAVKGLKDKIDKAVPIFTM